MDAGAIIQSVVIRIPVQWNILNIRMSRATGETGERPPGMLRAAAVVFWGRVWYNEADQNLERY